MKNTVLFLLTAVLVAVIALTACEGPVGPAGNANVTLYVFAGHHFGTLHTTDRFVTDLSRAEAERSGWLVYLVYDTGTAEYHYSVPGTGWSPSSVYQYVLDFQETQVKLTINRIGGTGEIYSQIRVVRIHANNVEGMHSLQSSISPRSDRLIPAWVDTSDYDAVIEYFGLR